MLQSNKISSFKNRHNFFKDWFFPAVISEWNSVDINIRNSSSINVFKKELLKFIRPEPKSTYNINNTKELKFLQDYGLDSVISNSGTTFKTVYLQCVIAVRILKQQLTSSSTVPIIIVQGKHSFTR